MTTGATIQRKRLLVVDDDPFVRGLFVRILSADRFEVLAMSAPSAALQLAQDERRPADLLVTDVVMPEMKGPALHRELSLLWPGLPVLYMSGYAQADLSPQGVDANAHFLVKPFNPTTLVAAVEGALPGDP